MIRGKNHWEKGQKRLREMKNMKNDWRMKSVANTKRAAMDGMARGNAIPLILSDEPFKRQGFFKEGIFYVRLG